MISVLFIYLLQCILISVGNYSDGIVCTVASYFPKSFCVEYVIRIVHTFERIIFPDAVYFLQITTQKAMFSQMILLEGVLNMSLHSSVALQMPRRTAKPMFEQCCSGCNSISATTPRPRTTPTAARPRLSYAAVGLTAVAPHSPFPT